MQTESAFLTGRPLPLARISRERFERMIEAAIWGPQDRVELLDGMVVTMSPQGHLHAYVVRRLDRILQRLCGDDAEVGTHLPFAAGDFQLPEPDLVVSPGRQSRGRHPGRRRVLGDHLRGQDRAMREVGGHCGQSVRCRRVGVYARRWMQRRSLRRGRGQELRRRQRLHRR